MISALTSVATDFYSTTEQFNNLSGNGYATLKAPLSTLLPMEKVVIVGILAKNSF